MWHNVGEHLALQHEEAPLEAFDSQSHECEAAEVAL
jgi:hypothetical protein